MSGRRSTTDIRAWAPIARALHFEESTLQHASRDRIVSATLAFRVARLAKVSVDDLLAGKFPSPGTCPRCGYNPRERATITYAPRMSQKPPRPPT